LSNEAVDPLLRNVYKVLLTRGMVGTVIHATDPETQRLLIRLAARAAVGVGRR
jgi:uncharacterized protein